ncbi:MAG TPA: hypothetical protein VMI54_12520, partial [Polyangiaceae bacterium]|nr:hypothetical protein [Polyangiaceae bacterium]
MTLVVAASSRDSIWMLTDRRLSYGKVKPPTDKAHKVMVLQATDGVAILGYSGLGATNADTEPADWMSRVIRGRNLTLDAYLKAIADAAVRELPFYLSHLRDPRHTIVVPAIVGRKVRIYSIELNFDRSKKECTVQRKLNVYKIPTGALVPLRVFAAGSGMKYLPKEQSHARWLFRLLKATDRGRMTPERMAQEFAKLNYEVHVKAAREEEPPTVGRSCIVVWRYRKGGAHGNGHRFFTDMCPDANTPTLPSIGWGGMDMEAFHNATFPPSAELLIKQLEAFEQGRDPNQIDTKEYQAKIDGALATLKYAP